MRAEILADYFSLPQYIIININDYLGIKSTNNFIKQMFDLIQDKSNNVDSWLVLIQQTKDVKIFFPHSYHRNLAGFLKKFLQNDKLSPECSDCLRRLCIQMIRNNPPLIYNQYEYINFPSPSIELMVCYLINGTVNQKIILQSVVKQQVIFDILSFILRSRLVGLNMVMYLFQGIRPELLLLTHKTVQTFDLIFGYNKYFYIQGCIEIPKQNSAFEIKQYSVKFFVELFDKYENQGYFQKSIRRKLMKASSNLNNQELKKQITLSNTIFRQIIQLLNDKYPQYIYNLHQQLLAVPIRKGKASMFQFLLGFKHFRNILLSAENIFQIFYKRKMDLIKLIWSEQETRQRICKVKVNNKNILEHVCGCYGCTHNIISLIWDSSLFDRMPEIRNRVSRKKIWKKYNLQIKQ